MDYFKLYKTVWSGDYKPDPKLISPKGIGVINVKNPKVQELLNTAWDRAARNIAVHVISPKKPQDPKIKLDDDWFRWGERETW